MRARLPHEAGVVAIPTSAFRRPDGPRARSFASRSPRADAVLDRAAAQLAARISSRNSRTSGGRAPARPWRPPGSRRRRPTHAARTAKRRSPPARCPARVRRTRRSSPRPRAARACGPGSSRSRARRGRHGDAVRRAREREERRRKPRLVCQPEERDRDTQGRSRQHDRPAVVMLARPAARRHRHQRADARRRPQQPDDLGPAGHDRRAPGRARTACRRTSR